MQCSALLKSQAKCKTQAQCNQYILPTQKYPFLAVFLVAYIHRALEGHVDVDERLGEKYFEYLKYYMGDMLMRGWARNIALNSGFLSLSWFHLCLHLICQR